MTHRARARFVVLSLALLIPVTGVFASIRTSSRNIVTADETVAEDVYAIGGTTIVEGTVRGDLVVAGGTLTISGTVEGDVLGVVAGTVRITGRVGGSVRVAALRFEADGEIGGDVGLLVGQARVDGAVARDVLLIGGEGVVGAAVGRDLRAQAWRLQVDGDIDRKVIVRSDDLEILSGARVGDDVTVQVTDRFEVSSEAAVGGRVIRRTILAPVWAKAAGRLFAWLSLPALLVAGILLTWLFRATARRAPQIAGDRPGRSALVGMGMIVVPPLLSLPLFLSLVGLPLAVLVLVGWLLALVLGPVPALTRFGGLVLRGRGGWIGGFVLGTLLWRGALWLLAPIAVALYLTALTIGLGSFTIAALEQRTRHLSPEEDWRPLPPETG
jgi:cytoskeletal protein CcmA (bactofilin family)